MTPPAPRAGEEQAAIVVVFYTQPVDLQWISATGEILRRETLRYSDPAARMALAEIAGAGDAAVRETGHRVGCPVNSQQGCACGATEAFKPLRANFYKLLTTHAAAIRGAK